MTVVRFCPHCRRALVADADANCANCGADVMVETNLQVRHAPLNRSARAAAIARHPDKTPLAAFRLERRIAKNLGTIEAVWFALQHDGYTWPRVEEYLTRRGLLP